VKPKNNEPGVSDGLVSNDRAVSAQEKRILSAVNNTTAGWLEQMDAFRRMEEDFGVRLVGCRTAREAIGLSTEWLAKRLDSLIAVQHRLLELWLECEASQSPVVAECRRPVWKRGGG
jgi:ribosome-binding protein aMBF1 (putative translation factor)